MKRFWKERLFNPIEGLVLLGMLGILAHSFNSLFMGWTPALLSESPNGSPLTGQIVQQAQIGLYSQSEKTSPKWERPYPEKKRASNDVKESRDAKRDTKTDRQPASLQVKSTDFVTLNFDCKASQAEKTASEKIRISGPFCTSSKSKNVQPKITLKNGHQDSAIETFTDLQNGTLTSAYFPLQLGENKITIRIQPTDSSTVFETKMTVFRTESRSSEQ